MKNSEPPYYRHRFPGVVIHCAVRWYFRFQLSLRSVGRNQIYCVGGGYTYGPFAPGGAYFNAHNPNVWYFGAAATVAATINGVPGSNLGTAPSLSRFASPSTYQSIAAGGAYLLGPARAGITGTNTAFKGLGDTSSGPTRSASPAARITTTPKSTASTT